ncbi:hypothetical protein Pelo_15260 [Pelomyxa schiedti]|nr:hypothetical protein Pelo_15260 [Pelomyxa schiedti]
MLSVAPISITSPPIAPTTTTLSSEEDAVRTTTLSPSSVLPTSTPSPEAEPRAAVLSDSSGAAPSYVDQNRNQHQQPQQQQQQPQQKQQQQHLQPAVVMDAAVALGTPPTSAARAHPSGGAPPHIHAPPEGETPRQQHSPERQQEPEQQHQQQEQQHQQQHKADGDEEYEDKGTAEDRSSQRAAAASSCAGGVGERGGASVAATGTAAAGATVLQGEVEEEEETEVGDTGGISPPHSPSIRNGPNSGSGPCVTSVESTKRQPAVQEPEQQREQVRSQQAVARSDFAQSNCTTAQKADVTALHIRSSDEGLLPSTKNPQLIGIVQTEPLGRDWVLIPESTPLKPTASDSKAAVKPKKSTTVSSKSHTTRPVAVASPIIESAAAASSPLVSAAITSKPPDVNVDGQTFCRCCCPKESVMREKYDSTHAHKSKLVEYWCRNYFLLPNARESLRELAFTRGGFVTCPLRKEAWSLLLGVDNHHVLAHQKSFERETYDPEIEKDVSRALHNPHLRYQRDHKVQELRAMLNALTESPLHVSYFQGCHDVASTFLLVSGIQIGYAQLEQAFSKILRVLSEPLQEIMSLMQYLPYVLRCGDLEVAQFVEKNYKSPPHFLMEWFLTLFYRMSDDITIVSRFYDVILASDTSMILFLCASIIIQVKRKLLRVRPKTEDIHHFLSKETNLILNLEVEEAGEPKLEMIIKRAIQMYRSCPFYTDQSHWQPLLPILKPPAPKTRRERVQQWVEQSSMMATMIPLHHPYLCSNCVQHRACPLQEWAVLKQHRLLQQGQASRRPSAQHNYLKTVNTWEEGGLAPPESCPDCCNVTCYECLLCNCVHCVQCLQQQQH